MDHFNTQAFGEREGTILVEFHPVFSYLSRRVIKNSINSQSKI